MEKSAEHYRAVLAVAVRDGKHDLAAQARHDMDVAVFERRIQALIDAAPTLTDEQRTKLAAILNPNADTAA